MKGWILIACCVGLVFADGTRPKPKATDYEVSAVSKKGAIGAEYVVRSYSGDRKTYIAKDHLIVEVALYPPKGEPIRVAAADFALRIDGKKPVLVAQAPASVVAAMKHVPWWRKGRGGAAGPGPGGLGGPGGVGLPPTLPGGGAGAPGAPGGSEESEPAYEALADSALPEGEFDKPVSGFIYFAWKGKPSSIKTLELLYEDAILKLR